MIFFERTNICDIIIRLKSGLRLPQPYAGNAVPASTPVENMACEREEEPAKDRERTVTKADTSGEGVERRSGEITQAEGGGGKTGKS